MTIGYRLGRILYDVVRFLRDKPFIPCQVDWDYRGEFVEPLVSHRQVSDYDEELGDIVVDIVAEWRGNEPRRPRQQWPNE